MILIKWSSDFTYTSPCSDPHRGKVYTNNSGSYKALLCLHFVWSDNFSLLLLPYLLLYRGSNHNLELLKCEQMNLQQPSRTVCTECTDWQMFRDAATQENIISLEEYTSSVTSYINKCFDDKVIIKTGRSFPSEKAWMNGEMRALTAKARLKAGSNEAKRRHPQQREKDFNTNSTKDLWQVTQMSEATIAGVPPSCARPCCQMSWTHLMLALIPSTKTLLLSWYKCNLVTLNSVPNCVWCLFSTCGFKKEII